MHSFHSLLADLAMLTRNSVVTALAPDHPFTLTTRPTPIQQKTFDLLGVAVTCTSNRPTSEPNMEADQRTALNRRRKLGLVWLSASRITVIGPQTPTSSERWP